jgi:hypothetical protein
MSPMMRPRGKDCANTISNVTMQRTAGSTVENANETRSIVDRQCAYCASGTIARVSQTGVTPQPCQCSSVAFSSTTSAVGNVEWGQQPDKSPHAFLQKGTGD